MTDPQGLTVGLIGCGGIMSMHIHNLLKIPHVTIGAMADPAAHHMERTKQRFPALTPALTFSGHREMLTNSKLDAVVIASPHAHHYQHIMDSLSAGCHVLVEKPFVGSVTHARKTITLARRRKKVLMISYQRHFEPKFRYMRKVVQEGRIGKVQTMCSALGQSWIELSRGTWRQDPRLSGGGQLNDSGSHIVDIALWITGLKPVEVYACLNFCDTKVDINSAVSVRLNNDAVWTISVSGNTPGFWEHTTIAGDKGSISLSPNGDASFLEGGSVLKGERFGHYHDQDAGFIRAARGQGPNEVPGEFGLLVTALTQAAFRSAKLKKPVRLNL